MAGRQGVEVEEVIVSWYLKSLEVTSVPRGSTV